MGNRTLLPGRARCTAGAARGSGPGGRQPLLLVRLPADDGAAVWTHYLVYDIVVGEWIARDAVRLGISRPVCTLALVLTFLAGPVGLLIRILVRGLSGVSAEQSAA